MNNFKLITTLIIALFAGFNQSANATDFCATTSAGLEFALAASEANGQSDIIRIAEGGYDRP